MCISLILLFVPSHLRSDTSSAQTQKILSEEYHNHCSILPIIAPESGSKEKCIPCNIATLCQKYSIQTLLTKDLFPDALPSADLIFCEDFFNHCSFKDIGKAIQHFKRSGAAYLLTTTFSNLCKNEDLGNRDGRPINLELPPFNFPPPIERIFEECSRKEGASADPSLGLWNLLDLPDLSVLEETLPFTHLSEPTFDPPGSNSYHAGVVHSLHRGLRSFSYPYNFNPKSLDRIFPIVLVTNNIAALIEAISWKKEGRIQFLIAGPNFEPFSQPEFLSKEVDCIIAASDWYKEKLERCFPQVQGKVVVWPAGVDVNYWKPISCPQIRRASKVVLLYWKTEPIEWIRSIEGLLLEKGYLPLRIQYRFYTPEAYRHLLAISRFSVFVSAHETQGIALAEAWAMDVPTLVWNPKKDPVYHGDSICSSAPYLCAELGNDWQSLDQLKNLVDAFETLSLSYRPRQWVLKELSDEASVTKFMQILRNRLCSGNEEKTDRIHQ